MLYFCYSSYYGFILSICALPFFLSASLPFPPDLSMGMPLDADSSLASSPDTSSTMPLPSNNLPPLSLPSTPPPTSLPLSIAAPTPDILTATEEPAVQLAPVTVTTTTPQSTPTITKPNTLGSNITNIPTGMNTTAPAVSLANAPLGQTLNELLTNTSSALSVYDKQTYSLLRSGSLQQKATAGLRPNTDTSATDADFQQNACTAGALQVTPKNKFDLPRAAHGMAKVSTMSFTRHKKKCTLSDDLFNNTGLEEKYKTLIKQLNGCPSFIPIFTKFHILALSQLYQYLIGIYVSLTMTHLDNIDSYILLEQLYGLNNKALIVQYLVDLIERQLNQALVELFPTLPKAFVVHSGLTGLQTDHISRLDLLFMNMERVVLATFGVKSIPPDQWKVVLNILNNPQYQTERKLVSTERLAIIASGLEEYLNSPNISSPSTPSFIQLLSAKQKSDLVDLLDILTEQFSSIQELEDCKHLNLILQNHNYSEFTEGEYTLLRNILSYCSLNKPLQDAITTITALQEKFTQSPSLSAAVLPEEFKFLQSLTAFILLYIQRGGIVGVHKLIQTVEPLILEKKSELSPADWKIFDSYKKNSAYPKIQQKKLALSLLSSPDLLQVLSATQKNILLTGVTNYISTHPSLTPNQLSIIQQLVDTIKSGGVSANDLMGGQKTLYTKIITQMRSYTPRDLSDRYLDKLFTDTFGPNYTTVINDERLTIEEVSTKLTTKERVIYYCWLQMLLEAIQYGVEKHTSEIDKFGCFSLYGNDIGKKFFKVFNYSDYKTFLKLDKVLNGNPDQDLKNLDSLTDSQKKLIMKLLSNLVAPKSINGKTSTPGVFETIKATLSKNPNLALLANRVKVAPDVNLAALSDKVASPDFSLTILTPLETQTIITFLQKYEELLLQLSSTKTPSSQTDTKGLSKPLHVLSKDEDLVASTVLSIVHAEMHLKNGQEDMIKSMGILFDFFASYTAKLHVNPGESVTVINKDFSQFTGYARAIAQQLSRVTKEKVTPAIFMYDTKTLEHLAFLPSLAQTIQSTAHLFIPTQAIDMALLLHPVPEKMVSGHSNNQVILQKDVPYNIPSLLVPNPDNPSSSFSPKFFFKDKDGKAFANGADLAFKSFDAGNKGYQSITHPKITWLTKTQVPTTGDVSHYKYYATRPLEGQEGIYMNVPLLSKDQGDNKNVLARLYEQKIVPQPDWLNDPEGVVAMIRACLGDFVTALTLDDTIFDPVINYIIRYTLVKNGSIPESAGTPKTRKLHIDDLQKSLEKYKELSQKELFDTYVGPMPSSTSQGATA